MKPSDSTRSFLTWLIPTLRYLRQRVRRHSRPVNARRRENLFALAVHRTRGNSPTLHQRVAQLCHQVSGKLRGMLIRRLLSPDDKSNAGCPLTKIETFPERAGADGRSRNVGFSQSFQSKEDYVLRELNLCRERVQQRPNALIAKLMPRAKLCAGKRKT